MALMQLFGPQYPLSTSTEHVSLISTDNPLSSGVKLKHHMAVLNTIHLPLEH